MSVLLKDFNLHFHSQEDVHNFLTDNLARSLTAFIIFHSCKLFSLEIACHNFGYSYLFWLKMGTPFMCKYVSPLSSLLLLTFAQVHIPCLFSRHKGIEALIIWLMPLYDFTSVCATRQLYMKSYILNIFGIHI